MKKLFILLLFPVVLASCKGRGTGPLVKESFNTESQDKVQNQAMDPKTHTGKVSTEKINISVEPGEGCITIANLLENKKSYSGKIVKVKGKVTKLNTQIMGKNWIHIQDGSEFQGEFDLTLTTDGIVTVGEIVTFEGKIALDKDFGYGYNYAILMEESKVIK
jgi:hypothetical protein